jgi:hypothetical protein
MLDTLKWKRGQWLGWCWRGRGGGQWEVVSGAKAGLEVLPQYFYQVKEEGTKVTKDSPRAKQYPYFAKGFLHSASLGIQTK